MLWQIPTQTCSFHFLSVGALVLGAWAAMQDIGQPCGKLHMERCETHERRNSQWLEERFTWAQPPSRWVKPSWTLQTRPAASWIPSRDPIQCLVGAEESIDLQIVNIMKCSLCYPMGFGCFVTQKYTIRTSDNIPCGQVSPSVSRPNPNFLHLWAPRLPGLPCKNRKLSLCFNYSYSRLFRYQVPIFV